MMIEGLKQKDRNSNIERLNSKSNHLTFFDLLDMIST